MYLVFSSVISGNKQLFHHEYVMVFDYYFISCNFRGSKSSNTFTMFANVSWAAPSITLMHSPTGSLEDCFVLSLEMEFVGFAVSLHNTVNSYMCKKKRKKKGSLRELACFS